MYNQKYIKYKTKYINSKMNKKGGGKNIILLDGTSTAGKSTISKYLIKDGYAHICNDDYGPIAYRSRKYMKMHAFSIFSRRFCKAKISIRSIESSVKNI